MIDRPFSVLLLCFLSWTAAPASGQSSVCTDSLSLADSVLVADLIDKAWELKSSKPQQAHELADRALLIALAIRDTSGQADAMHATGMIYWYKADYEKASDYYFQALRLREQLNDQLGLGRSFNNIGNVFFHQRDYGQALDYYLAGLRIRESLKDTAGLAYSYNNIGDVYAAQGKHDAAFDAYRKGSELARQANFKPGLSFVSASLGKLFEQAGQPDSAYYYYLLALSTAQADRNDYHIALSLYRLAAMERYALTQRMLWAERSLEITKEIGTHELEAEATKLLAGLYADNGNYPAAYEQLEHYQELHQRIQNENSERAILEIQKKYELARVEKDFVQREADLRAKEQQINRLSMGVIMLVGFTILTIIAFYLFSRYRFQVRTNKLLAQRNQEFAEQNEALRRTNNALEQFAYMASHDLREPLRSIGSFATLFEKRYGEQLDRKGLTYLDFIRKGVKHMYALLEDILTLSRLAQEGQQMAFEPVDLNATLSAVCQSLHTEIAEKQVMLTADTLPTISAHAMQMHQLFQNLISNGMKFNRNPSPSIHIGYTARDDQHHLWVRDNGIGIEADYHQKIFQAFQRLYRNQFPGTGIGLAICQRIIQHHRGNIWVDSEPGQGTTFHFTIPADLNN